MLCKLVLVVASIVLQPRVPTEPEVIAHGQIDGEQVIANPLRYAVTVELSCGYDWEPLRDIRIEAKDTLTIHVVEPSTGHPAYCRVNSWAKATKNKKK